MRRSLRVATPDAQPCGEGIEDAALELPNSTAPQFDRERQALIKTQACRTASRCHFGFNDIEQVLMGVDIELRVDMLDMRLHRVA